MWNHIVFGYGDVCSAQMETIGKRIERLRLGKLTQAQLAAAVGVTQPTISDYEKFAMPPADKLALLAEALAVTMDYLVYGEEVDAAEANLVGCFRAIPDNLKTTILTTAQALAGVASRADFTEPFSILTRIKALP